jgi:hypothetical protein
MFDIRILTDMQSLIRLNFMQQATWRTFMSESRRLAVSTLILVIAMAVVTACAASNSSTSSSSSSGGMPPGPPQGSQHGPTGVPPGPPPEAIEACKGKSVGAQVSFTLRNGDTLKGICQMQNGTLAAMPAGRPPPNASGSGPSGNRPPPPPGQGGPGGPGQN